MRTYWAEPVGRMTFAQFANILDIEPKPSGKLLTFLEALQNSKIKTLHYYAV